MNAGQGCCSPRRYFVQVLPLHLQMPVLSTLPPKRRLLPPGPRLVCVPLTTAARVTLSCAWTLHFFPFFFF